MLLNRRGRLRIEQLPVVGLAIPRGAAGFAELGTIFLRLDQAQDLFGRDGQINTISIVLDEGVDEAAVRKAIEKAIEKALPAEAEAMVRPPAARIRVGRDSFLNAEQGLSFACGLVILLAVVIILNTFLMNVSERRRQLAILRALGATRRQLMGMLLGEGLAMGVAGTALGTLLGTGGAVLATAAMARLSGSPAPHVQWSVVPFLLAGALGPGAALLGAYLPARLAGKVSPLEGIRAVMLSTRAAVSFWLTASGLLLLGGSGLMLWACIRGWLPVALSVPSGVVFLGAFALVFPIFLGPLAHAAALLLRPLVGVEGELAWHQIVRRPSRAGLTSGVLYVAVATAIGLGTTILSNVEDVHRWQRRTMAGDFFVRAMFQDHATGKAIVLPESVGDEIRKLPGVTYVGTVRFLPIEAVDPVEAADMEALLVVRDFDNPDDFLPLSLIRDMPEPKEVRRRLRDGEVVVGSVLAQRTGKKPGDEIVLKAGTSPRSFRIAAIAVEYSTGGLTVFMERRTAQQAFHVEGADAFVVDARPDSRAAVDEQLEALCRTDGLLVHSQAKLAALLDSVMQPVVRGLWGLLGLGFVVAGFGIANTLTMNVLEQTREIALLRDRHDPAAGPQNDSWPGRADRPDEPGDRDRGRHEHGLRDQPDGGPAVGLSDRLRGAPVVAAGHGLGGDGRGFDRGLASRPACGKARPPGRFAVRIGQVDSLWQWQSLPQGKQCKRVAKRRPSAAATGKGDRHLLCEAPEGPFGQKVPVPFSRFFADPSQSGVSTPCRPNFPFLLPGSCNNVAIP